jgi:hypothetical protein
MFVRVFLVSPFESTSGSNHSYQLQSKRYVKIERQARKETGPRIKRIQTQVHETSGLNYLSLVEIHLHCWFSATCEAAVKWVYLPMGFLAAPNT